MRKTTGFFTNSWRIKIVLESNFEGHAQDVLVDKSDNFFLRISLLNTYFPRAIATILKALREQLTWNDLFNVVEEIAEPEIHLAYDQILKGGRFWDDVNGGSLPEDLVLVARREEIDRVFSVGENEIVPMQECKDAGMRPLDLIWKDTDKYLDPAHKKCRYKLCAKEYNTKKQGQILRILFVSQFVLCNATSESCEGACLNHDVGESVEQRETIEVETLRNQQSTFPRNSSKIHLHPTSRRRSSEMRRRQSWQIGQHHVWNSRCFPNLAT